MADFHFIKIPNMDLWVVNAPKRAHHAPGKKVCVFCPGNEKDNPEVYRIGGEKNDENLC